jgi:uncharacterized protein (TIGR02246 family)
MAPITREHLSPASIRWPISIVWQIGPDAYIVRTRGGLLMPGETEIHPERLGIQTWVVVRKGGAWLAAAYQNTRIEQY